MNKVKNLFLAFAIVGLLVSVSTIKVEAGCFPTTPPSGCVDCCKGICDAGPEKHLDCTGLTGEERKDCTTLNNIFATCCYHDCLEESCGSEDVPGESVVCDALESLCEN